MVSGIYTAWTTCSRRNTSQVTGPNIQLIRVVSVGENLLAPGTKLFSYVYTKLCETGQWRPDSRIQQSKNNLMIILVRFDVWSCQEVCAPRVLGS